MWVKISEFAANAFIHLVALIASPRALGQFSGGVALAVAWSCAWLTYAAEWPEYIHGNIPERKGNQQWREFEHAGIEHSQHTSVNGLIARYNQTKGTSLYVYDWCIGDLIYITYAV